MKIDPPIPVSLPYGDGHVTEMDDSGIVTVVLDSGEVITINGNKIQAKLYGPAEPH